MSELLSKLNLPRDIRTLSYNDLAALAAEVRKLIIETTSVTGGHLSSSLGVVELAVALHAVYDSPKDRIIWDVGHQSYAHKIITSRSSRFGTLRQRGGISGFPNKDESPHDPFTVGHASNSISLALGLSQGEGTFRRERPHRCCDRRRFSFRRSRARGHQQSHRPQGQSCDRAQ